MTLVEVEVQSSTGIHGKGGGVGGMRTDQKK